MYHNYKMEASVLILDAKYFDNFDRSTVENVLLQSNFISILHGEVEDGGLLLVTRAASVNAATWMPSPPSPMKSSGIIFISNQSVGVSAMFL